MLGTTLILGALALAVSPAEAAEIRSERPPTPAMSLEEAGAMSIWTNPANLGFDPDPSSAFFYGWSPDGKDAAPRSFTFAGSGGPLGLGFVHQQREGRPSWSTLTTNLAIPVAENTQLGFNVGWQIPDGPDNNFATFDLGWGWRPLSWWGLSLVGQNLGVSERHTGIQERFSIGSTLRPWGEALELSGAYHRYSSVDADIPGYAEAVVKTTPVEDFGIRLSADQLGTFGIGIEFGFGVGTIEGHMSRNQGNDLPSMALVGTTASPDTGALFKAKRTVRHVVMDERFPYQPIRNFFFREGESYLHMLGRLNDAASDQSTKALLIEIDWTPFSFAQIEEILSVFDKARANGKKVVAYIDQDAGNSAYMLASGADHIIMNPAQQLMLVGLSAELMHFRETLDLVGVEPQFTKRSEYKAAAEALTNTRSSKAQREQVNALLDDLSGRLVARIAKGRNKSVEDVQALIDQGPFTVEEAKQQGLIDAVAYPDELKKAVAKRIGRGNLYVKNHVDTHTGWRATHEVAVIFIEGTITTGKSQMPGILGGGRTAGSVTIREQLEEAANTPSVKAVILRVDSPGGSALASDEIWRAVSEVQRGGKPVIVSMGGVAASGGYYVSANADAIFAQHSTVTGSIGVIAGKFSLAGLYDKIGANHESYIRGRNAGMFSMARPFDEHEFAAFDKMVGDIYGQFTSKVAKGRNMELPKVVEVAGGRVWSGTRAHGVKLVDEIGGFYEALARAKKEAKIPAKADAKLIAFGQRLGPEEALERMSVSLFQRSVIGMHPRSRTLPEIEMLRQIQAMGDERVWAMMPYTVDVR